MSMTVMVVGSGGREHAICWSLSADPGVDRIVAVPGNPGIARLGKAECVPVDAADFSALADVATAEDVDVTIVGPEQPLADGVADYFRGKGLALFGPTGSAARLESSKWFAKELMLRLGVPTPSAEVFEGPESLSDAASYIERTEGPWVVKADGLAGGKGVLVTPDPTQAIDWARGCLLGERFGRAGSRILVEEFAEGREVSVLVVTDGTGLLALPPARDHKRLEDGDTGPNTGGMGAYSPVPDLGDADLDSILEKIFEPVVEAMRKEGEPYLGILYGGLVLTEEGPKVLEFNVRFGDPEAQAVLPRLQPVLSEIIDAALSGNIDAASAPVEHPAAVTVVAAARGYPKHPVRGDLIEGLDEASAIPGATVFHAGTSESEGRLYTAGGRVLAVSAVGDDLDSARHTAYDAVSRISFEGMQYRSDIALGVGER